MSQVLNDKELAELRRLEKCLCSYQDTISEVISFLQKLEQKAGPDAPAAKVKTNIQKQTRKDKYRAKLHNHQKQKS